LVDTNCLEVLHIVTRYRRFHRSTNLLN